MLNTVVSTQFDYKYGYWICRINIDISLRQLQNDVTTLERLKAIYTPEEIDSHFG
jgi:hypothetical protein